MSKSMPPGGDLRGGTQAGRGGGLNSSYSVQLCFRQCNDLVVVARRHVQIKSIWADKLSCDDSVRAPGAPKRSGWRGAVGAFCLRYLAFLAIL